VKFFVETYGCTMNQGESSELAHDLVSLGHEPVVTAEEAEIALINTCIVIRPTELKIWKRIRELNQQGKELIIAGCIPAVHRDELMKELPTALIIEPKEYPGFGTLAEGRFGRGPGMAPIMPTPVAGIIPISQGCIGACSYCLTKKARGDLASYPLDRLVSIARDMVLKGHKELMVTAQDTGCYGFDISRDLADLIDAIVKIEGDHMIRVGMMNPDSLDLILDRYVNSWLDPKVYKFLHLPVQSGSDPILRSMCRGYSVSTFEMQVARFREAYPRMSLSTDVITGFPGETDDDHALTVEMLKRVQPTTVNVTRFSPRPGTPAARAKNQVPGWVSKERSREIAKLRFQIAKVRYSDLVGASSNVLVTEIGKGDTMISRTVEYVPVVLPKKDLRLGQWLKVEITDCTSTHLYGKMI
jgi:threonylcarbamoyladenosine tRNA methylthiotransferase CDKAL1